MTTGQIIGIVAAVVAVIVIAVVVAVVAKRKSVKGDIKGKDGSRMAAIDTSREIIARNSKSYDALVALYDEKITDAELKDKLAVCGKDLRYLAPSVKKSIYAIDEKISDKIDDLKVAFSKKEIDAKDVEEALFAVRKALGDRSVEY